MRITRTPDQRPLSRGLKPLAYGLAAVVGLVLCLTWGALQVQVTLAGFLNGESLWSKAQKQTVIDLLAYARAGDPARLNDFYASYAVVNSDRWARDTIAAGHYDKRAVYAA